MKNRLDLIEKKLIIDCNKEFSKVKRFLISQLRQANLKKAIVAISGGIDSSVVATICCKVLGAQNVVVLKLPYKGVSSGGSEKDADKLINFLKIPKKNVLNFRINGVVDNYKKQLKPSSLRLGNVMARTRMIYVYDTAKKYGGLVIGTCNKSELLLGYETRYGDGACDMNFLANLYKNQIYQLARFFDLPQSIIEKEPSAELWPGQTDQKELGFSYEWLDPLLYLLFDKKLAKAKIVKDYGYKKSDVLKIIRMVENNRFKQLLPPTC